MAIKFEKIKPGMVLYDVRKATGLQRYNVKWSTWHVCVVEVNADRREVLASWNSNPPEWMSERRITKFRANKPNQEIR